MNSIKISVFTTSYNQENYISEAIESVLNQSILPYEYIICDDCSQDKTWEIVENYQKKYPNIIRAYRNEVNLGLYQNFNYAQSLVTGNVITCVSGDDLILPGYFEDIIQTIQSNSLDPELDSFMIISNIVNLFENGMKTYSSNYRYKNKNLFSLRLRYLLDERFAFVSKKSFDHTPPFNPNLGLHADFLWGFERIINTEKFVFINNYHHVYRVGVGVSSKVTSKESIISYQKVLEGVHEKYMNLFTPKDELYYKFISQKSKYLLNKNFENYLKLFILIFRNLLNFYNSKKMIKALTLLFIPENFKKNLLNFNIYKILSK